MNKVGERVKRIRQHQGLSQIQFAQSINRSPGLISKVEKGRSSVSEETIKVICAAFGVNEEWLISGKGEMGCGDAADKAGVGKRVEEVRNENNLTQEEFAEKIGYCKRQIECVEIGEINPSHQFLRKVATTFSVNYSWIISGKGKKEVEKIKLKEELIDWLEKNPDVVRELEIRSGVVSTPEK